MQAIQPYKSKGLIRKKRIRGSLYASLLMLALTIVTFSIYHFQHEALHQDQIEKEIHELHEMAQIIHQELFMVGSDLSYITQSSLAQATLGEKNSRAKEHLTNLMVGISTTQNAYDQIRILDQHGQEIIRVNYHDGNTPTIPTTPQLQVKKDRYYFSETKKLLPKQIYTSPFDLNIENGQIESPRKPVIRFSSPIYSKTGKFLGIGVVNYLGNRLLTKLEKRRSHSTDPYFILNKKGHYIKGSQPAEEWLFMFNKDQPALFPMQKQKVWDKATRAQDGDIATDTGHYFFTHINCAPPSPFLATNKQPLLLVLHSPLHKLKKKASLLTFKLLKGFILLGPLMIFIGWKLGSYQVRQNHLFKVLKHEASHDPLTELYNRKAIHVILRRSMTLALRRKTPLALGYLDIDGLKKMNDTIGHEAGDQLIQGAAKAISAIIRDSDSAARVGGDEFLIIFPDCDAKNACIVLERIKLHFAEQGLEKTGHKWLISTGCAELLQSDDSVEHIIERADTMMYKNKRLAKCHTDRGDTSAISARR